MAGRKKTSSKKKAPTKKSVAKKAPRKKAVVKKVVAKKAPRKKEPPKKSRVKKPQPKKPKKSKSADEGLSFETSYSALAKTLGVTRQSLHRWCKIDGAPESRSDGRHCVEEWRKFMSTKDLSGKSHDLESLKARDLLAKCEEREFKMAVKRGEFVSVEMVRLTWGSCISHALQLLEKALLDELPPILAGKNPLEIRADNERVVTEVRRLLHKGEGLTP